LKRNIPCLHFYFLNLKGFNCAPRPLRMVRTVRRRGYLRLKSTKTAAAPTPRLTARHSYARYEFASLPMFSASANHSRSSMA
ncbi:hypothetical protein D6Z79_11925, partial [Neisseria gonorrhoeae]